jgi:hypothetical protein
MARIRTIKPNFFTSEDIVSLSPLARLLYIALWCESDKEGRMVWKPKTFKMRYLPADDCDIDELCKEITDAGLVKLYGGSYAYIPAFHAHQHINPRESSSQLPEPEQDKRLITRQPRVEHASATRQPRDSDVQVGREGKGKEGNEEDASGFAQFYQAYPKKAAKPAAEKAFKAARINGDLDKILADIERRKSGDDWQKDGGKYIPNPATYLSQRRWEDQACIAGKPEPKPWEGAR